MEVKVCLIPNLSYVEPVDLFDITNTQERLFKECDEWIQLFTKGLRDDDIFYDASFDLCNEFLKVGYTENVFDYSGIKKISRSLLGVYRTLLPFQAQQSGVGDCWLISALMAISRRPEAIKRIIPEGSYSLKHGIFLVRLFKDGEPQIIVVDGHFPIRRGLFNQFIFLLDGSMWSSLIEKAAAKLFGGYAKLHGNSAAAGFRLLTGAPCVKYRMKNVGHPAVLWDKLVDFHSKNFPMALAAEYTDKTSHVQAILDVRVHNGHPLILLGNVTRRLPGKWKWENFPTLSKKSIEYFVLPTLQNLVEKKMLWIEIDEMINHFTRLTVCKYREGWYEMKTPNISQNSPEKHLRVEVGKRCQLIIERTEARFEKEVIGVGLINIHKAHAQCYGLYGIVKSFQVEQSEVNHSVETDQFELEPGNYAVIYINALLKSEEDYYWVFRSPTPLDHISVHVASKKTEVKSPSEWSLLEMMEGRVGKEIEKGVFLRDYSNGNVVVLAAENKTKKTIGIDVIAKSADHIYSPFILTASNVNDDPAFDTYRLFQVPAKSTKILGCITRSNGVEMKEDTKFKCFYKTRVFKGKSLKKWTKKHGITYEYFQSWDEGIPNNIGIGTNSNRP